MYPSYRLYRIYRFYLLYLNYRVYMCTNMLFPIYLLDLMYINIYIIMYLISLYYIMYYFCTLHVHAELRRCSALLPLWFQVAPWEAQRPRRAPSWPQAGLAMIKPRIPSGSLTQLFVNHGKIMGRQWENKGKTTNNPG